MEDAKALRAVSELPLEQVLVADGEQRRAKRRKHRHLIVGPLDRRERRANGLNLFTIVKRLAANEHVADTSCLERLHVRLRDVFAETEKPPEQKAHMLGLKSYGLLTRPLGDLPAALADHP